MKEGEGRHGPGIGEREVIGIAYEHLALDVPVRKFQTDEIPVLTNAGVRVATRFLTDQLQLAHWSRHCIFENCE